MEYKLGEGGFIWLFGVDQMKPEIFEMFEVLGKDITNTPVGFEMLSKVYDCLALYPDYFNGCSVSFIPTGKVGIALLIQKPLQVTDEQQREAQERSRKAQRDICTEDTTGGPEELGSGSDEGKD